MVQKVLAVADDVLQIGDAEYNISEIDRILVVVGGNAAGQIATTLETILDKTEISRAVVTDGNATTTQIETLPGDHPLPSSQCVESTRQMTAHAAKATQRDLVLANITGGGSSLMAVPAGNLRLDHIRKTTDELLACGVPISELNTARKHLSSVKGGQLARIAQPAQSIGLLLSDVVGNDPSVIDSSPTVPDDSTYDDAISILDRFKVDVPDPVVEHFERGVAGLVSGTPDATNLLWDSVSNHILADGRVATPQQRRMQQPTGMNR